MAQSPPQGQPGHDLPTPAKLQQKSSSMRPTALPQHQCKQLLDGDISLQSIVR